VPSHEPNRNVWEAVLDRLRSELDSEEFRRWFQPTAYASDSGDRVTIWVPSESIRRHLQTHYDAIVRQTLASLGRRNTVVRIVVSGFEDEDEEE
jgi:chromosomal replication initiation ATPase DnaA